VGQGLSRERRCILDVLAAIVSDVGTCEVGPAGEM
jgi:hypothetical protein